VTFGERFAARCDEVPYPVCVGLDPRLEEIPAIVRDRALERSISRADALREAIARFHTLVIGATADLVPAVKLQLAFYEQYGVPGMLAFCDTIAAARRAGLLVIADGKRNDIASTAAAYANAFLGRADVFGESTPAFDADALTVNPYLGWDSLVPFAETAAKHGKGVFVLVHTSNPSSEEFQEALVEGEPIYLRVARLVSKLEEEFLSSGDEVGSVGAIVGCTFPEAAASIRSAIPRAPIVVVGYGAQAGTLAGCAACFTTDGRGAAVNASRSLTYGWASSPTSEQEVIAVIRANVTRMGDDLLGALTAIKVAVR
jgi:orotidine-5'-phosphate decarboxylase